MEPYLNYIVAAMQGTDVKPLYFGITWLFLWGLDKQKIYLRM